MKAIVIVLDSVGIGQAPDAAAYGDDGAYTLQHLAEYAGGVKAPVLTSMGLGNIPPMLPKGRPIAGIDLEEAPIASYGAMEEQSEGKDTITGHWEIAGLEVKPGFHQFPGDYPSFPASLIAEFEAKTGRKTIGHKASSGTVILDELGEEASRNGSWIVYTSADSVFQIAANVDVIPLKELYAACDIARELCNPFKVGRVIARPFIGTPGHYTRTEDRRDYAYLPENRTILEHCRDAGIDVYAIGKIEDIYVHRGITHSNHTGNTEASQKVLEQWTKDVDKGFLFANFIDFDMLYGHRRDPGGYAKAIEQTDGWLGHYLPLLTSEDLLIITADHGNDPTFKGTDHCREYVPLLVYQPGKPVRNLGIRKGFYDVAQSVASFFGLDPMPLGTSFLGNE
ncbi:MAG: phosphopentomutase [Spartobacteria bacterium]|nr:phosphopentomutase [Spartobacteria bacterium]